MTTGENDPTAAYGQPTGFPPPQSGDDEATTAYVPPVGYPPAGGTPGEPTSSAFEPPATGFEAQVGYVPPPPPAGYTPQGYPPPPAGYPAAPGYVPPAPGYVPPAPGYAPPAPGYAPPAGAVPPAPGYGPIPGAGYPPPPDPYGAAAGGYYPGTPPMGWGQPGDLMSRLGARLIDGLGVGIVAYLLSLLFDGNSRYLVAGVFGGILTFLYFVLFESQMGRTPGKMLLGLHVRGPGGSPKPTFQQSAVRNAFLLLNLVPCLGGLLSFAAWIYIAVTIENSPTKQGKHDEIAGGTQVVKEVKAA